VANEQALTVPEPNGFIRYPKPNGLDGARADALHDTSYGKLVLGPQQCGLSFQPPLSLRYFAGFFVLKASSSRSFILSKFSTVISGLTAARPPTPVSEREAC